MIEALVNEKINFTPQQWKDLVENRLDATDTDGKWIRCLAHVPDLMRRCKTELNGVHFPKPRILDLTLETASLLEDCKAIIFSFRERLAAFNAAPRPARLASLFHANCLRLLALGLATGIILNCILRALGDQSESTRDLSSRWAKEISELAKVAVKYQPLGSMSMLICLPMAYVGASDPILQGEIMELIANYERACLKREPPDWIRDLEKTKRRITLQGP